MRYLRVVVLLLIPSIVGIGPAGCSKPAKVEPEAETAVAKAADHAAPTPPAPVRPAPTPAPAAAPPQTKPERPRFDAAQPLVVAPVAGLPAMPAPAEALPAVPPPLLPTGPATEVQAPAAPQPAAPAAPQLATQPPSAPPEPSPADMAKKPEWPLAVNGKPLSEFVREVNDSDPAIREQSLRAFPMFGPPARKDPGVPRAILYHMEGSKEPDPGVRAAAFEAAGALFGYESEDDKKHEEDPKKREEEAKKRDLDTREAIRILFTAADKGVVGSPTRLHAIQTLAKFGAKAEPAIDALVGQNMTRDVAYETRRAIAATLGQIGFHERIGPSPRVLHCLADVLIKDKSAAVRLEAYQSLVMLGPPYLPRPADAMLLKDIKDPAQIPKVDDKVVAQVAKAIKARLGPYKPEPGDKDKDSATGLVERDKQVEIFARLALMRIDPKEITDENMSAIAKYVHTGFDTGPKLMALNALSLMGTGAARKLDDVCKGLMDDNPIVVNAAVGTLVAMGDAAKPAIPLLEKLPKEREGKDDDKKSFPSKEKEKEYWTKLTEQAIKVIKEAKPRQ